MKNKDKHMGVSIDNKRLDFYSMHTLYPILQGFFSWGNGLIFHRCVSSEFDSLHAAEILFFLLTQTLESTQFCDIWLFIYLYVHFFFAFIMSSNVRSLEHLLNLLKYQAIVSSKPWNCRSTTNIWSKKFNFSQI